MKMTKWTAAALVVFLASFLASCKGMPTKELPHDVKVERHAPAEAMVKCPGLAGLEDDSFGAVVRKLNEVLGLYKDCASRHGQLVDYENSTPSK